MNTMTTAEFMEYGGPEQVSLQQRPMPSVGADQLLVKTLATTVSAADSRIRSLTVPKGYGLIMRLMFGLCRPRIRVLGTEMVGEVVAVGNRVSRFQCGDLVVGYSGSKLGCHAEYRLFRETDAVIPKPARLAVDEAAALAFGGTAALDFLVNKGRLQAGEKVLVIGAAGAVGSAAVQLAHHLGAEVTAVCSAANAELVRSLGTADVIDYQQQDPLEQAERYDVIFDAVGGNTIERLEWALKPSGRALLVVADLPITLKATFHKALAGKQLIAGVASESAEVLQQLGKQVAEGALVPVIDGIYSFSEIADAHRRTDSGHKRGSVVVRVTALSAL
ncbi:NAD(P)-dependent alcohol dehydrogenase [Oceanobacter mangrovi]|uniref:NAD(P)-dependent alcohol dehydrogenase n=1 Tax=Oceanobacter mangrovi TaxID=2862510 RepID=UPI001C8D5E07|nr:NAD(P)-dependent alcohol dehydrogenase [Oceanobacter mangrovi]